MTPRNAPRISRIAAGTALALAAVALAGCDGKKAGGGMMGRGPAAVAYVVANPQAVPLSTELTGRTSAFRVADVRPQVGGVILKRLFVEGGDVKAGQQLYQIDPAPYQATLDSAKADLAKAEAAVKTTRAKLDRYKDLVTIDAVSRQDYDDLVATLAEDIAAVDSAKASVRTAQINLDYTRVYSPITGRIGRSAVTEGALVTANQTTVLATVQQLDPLYVDITQSAGDLFQLRHAVEAGQVKGAPATEAPISLYIDGIDGPYGEPGRLQFTDVTVDTTTSMVTLRAIVANPRKELLPGLFVRAKVDEGARQGAMLIPQQAVSRNPEGTAMVWVVGDDNKANPRPVSTLQAIGANWVVTSGLNAGDKVIVDGLQALHPGVEVKAQPATPAPAQPTTPAANAHQPL